MKSNHKVSLSDKQVEFLVKCIDISQSTQSLKPDKSESDLIRELTKLNEEIQDDKLGNESIFYDLN
jgi:hypothetical protein